MFPEAKEYWAPTDDQWGGVLRRYKRTEMYVLPLLIPQLKIVKGVSIKIADISHSCMKHIFKREPFIRYSDF